MLSSSSNAPARCEMHLTFYPLLHFYTEFCFMNFRSDKKKTETNYAVRTCFPLKIYLEDSKQFDTLGRVRFGLSVDWKANLIEPQENRCSKSVEDDLDDTLLILSQAAKILHT